ncbi:hypothetical protein IAT38_008052 [Cryptococcus sp. DSM 104549]
MAVVLQPLPWTLDLSCPLPKPAKPLTGVAWPFAVAGPSCLPDEAPDAFIKRRYLETLYLPEILSPLSGFAADLQRISHPPSSATFTSPSPLPSLLKPLMLSLPSIDTRHRKTILPFLSASTAPTAPPESLSQAELGMIRMALDLRVTSRLALDDGVVVGGKKIADQLEKRETLIQIIFLLLYLNASPNPTSAPKSTSEPTVSAADPEPLPKPKKRKRRQATEPDTPAVTSPTEDPAAAIELLLDRCSVWQAVADLGIGIDLGGQSAGKAGKVELNPVGAMLQQFWDTVLLPSFLQTNPTICSSYHLKVFGKPIPEKLLPQPSTVKKSRKPKLTRAMPSADGELFPLRGRESLAADRGGKGKQREGDVGNGREREMERSMSRPHSRAPSRAPSEVSVGSTMDLNPSAIRRSISRTESQSQAQSHSQSQLRRSRSRSTDLIGKPESGFGSFGSGVGVGGGGAGESGRGSASVALAGAIKKPISRAQSGKDLFKGREVGLMRRTGSKKVDMNAASGSGSASQGLGAGRELGREDSQSQGRFGLLGRKISGGKDKDKPVEDTNTIIMATPSKPRYAFAAPSYPQWQHPTPIREEPSSGPRPSYIAETPVAPGRMTGNVAYASGEEADDPGEESDDPLGDLMVMTDDEDEAPPAKRAFVPETPGR